MSAIPGVETPELDKMHAPSDCDGKIVTHSQMIGRFLDWLNDEKIHLAVWLDTKEVAIHRQDLPRDEWGDPPEGGRYTNEYRAWMREIVKWEEEERIEPMLVPSSRRFDALLHDYFEIDANEIERERRALLAALRESANAG